MAFVSGVQIIDVPAGALNNSGMAKGSDNENTVAVKYLEAGIRPYKRRLPYVSAQAYRNWLRNTLAATGNGDWTVAPIFREKKVAYTDANPITYADDDVFGYMRAPGKKVEASDSRAEMVGDTPTKETVTRVSPFRVGTLVGLADSIANDFGTMSRHNGDPVPYEHQFYRTSLKGMFSLDLGSIGKFTYVRRTGYLNLDEERVKRAQEEGLEHIESEQAYRLPYDLRVKRAASVLRAMPVITGGAKQTLHYTDVSPVVIIAAITQGGNNPFQYAIDADMNGQAKVDIEALEEIGSVWGDTILSPVYIGWVRGYARDNQKALEEVMSKLSEVFPFGIVLDHPRKIMEVLANSLKDHPEWWG